ncbi:Metallo-hydrolase/oxidoreductase, partial [Ramicandelaber brevisporus]
IIFLGTGTSGSLPSNLCINSHPGSPCTVCLSCLDPCSEQGFRNRRRNSSIIVRYQDPHSPNSRLLNVLIDCGKSYYEAAKDWMVEHNVPCIDALILTHGHADAMMGLDDLREWTAMRTSLRPTASIPVYLTRETMRVVQRAFPYIADPRKATGGGAVAALQFIVIDGNEVFAILDGKIRIMPLPVEHGPVPVKVPFISHGFRFGNVVYISDASGLCPETPARLHNADIHILDILRDYPHASHWSVEQAIEVAKHFKPRLMLSVGMGHELDTLEFNQALAQTQPERGFPAMAAHDGMRL